MTPHNAFVRINTNRQLFGMPLLTEAPSYLQDIPEHCEIVSLNGTVSAARCHLHIALSREDLSTIGGHLTEGCIINTTCELVIAELPGLSFGVEQDAETGYDELIFAHNA